jgi:NitT/TauT family transport system ATP-binding protein
MIHIEGLSHRFGGDVFAVKDFNLSIAPGEFVSIVGPSGCGKTTVLNIVAGLLDAEDGTVTAHGAPPKAGRHDVAYMLARDSLFPWLTALQNAEVGSELRGEPADARRERARELLQAVGLKGFEDKLPKALSHGMRQRVALARTFCLDSEILLMDEPFGALDAQTKLQLEEVLLRLWAQMRRTVIFITHDLAEAVVLSDRVIVMSRRPGRIVANIPIPLKRPRSVSDLQRDHEYHELYAQVWSRLEEGMRQEREETL